jgi:hypothetical protein
MNVDGIKFVEDIIGDLISIPASCACQITGEVEMVTDRLVVVIVKPPV